MNISDFGLAMGCDMNGVDFQEGGPHKSNGLQTGDGVIFVNTPQPEGIKFQSLIDAHMFGS